MIKARQVFFWTSNLKGHGFQGDKATILYLTLKYYSLFSIYVRSHVTFASAILMEYQICSIHNSQCSFLSVFYCNVVVVSRIIAFNFDYI